MGIVPIYFGKKWTVKGQFLRRAEVTCEHCNQPFSIEDQIYSQGDGSSFLGLQDQQAIERADREMMRDALSTAGRLEPAPCPHCLHLQSNMQSRRMRQIVLRVVSAILALLLTWGLYAFWKNFDAGWGLKLFIFLGMLFLGLIFILPFFCASFSVKTDVKELNDPIPTPDGKRIGIRNSQNDEWLWLDNDAIKSTSDNNFKSTVLKFIGGPLVFIGCMMVAVPIIVLSAGMGSNAIRPGTAVLAIGGGILLAAGGGTLLYFGMREKE